MELPNRVGEDVRWRKNRESWKKQLRGGRLLLDFSSATETGAALKVEARALKSGWFLLEGKTIFQKTRSLEPQSRKGVW